MALSAVAIAIWRGGRVVECARLEIECSESYRGFESLPLRFCISAPFWQTLAFVTSQLSRSFGAIAPEMLETNEKSCKH